MPHRVDPSERRRQRSVHPRDIRQARRAREPCAHTTQVPQHQQDGDDRRHRREPARAKALHQRGSRLRHAVGDAYRVVRQRHEHRGRPEDVHPDDGEPGNHDAPAQGAGGVVDLIAQRGCELEPGEGEGHRGEQVDRLQIEARGNEAARGDRCRAAVRRERPDRERHENEPRQPGAVAAQILQPFAHAEAYHVQAYREPQPHERHNRDEQVVIAQVHEAWTGGVGGNRRGGDEERREIEQVVDPISPPGHEAMRGPEGAPHPAVDAARARVDVGELAHGDRRRQEEHDHREQPQSQAGEPELARGRGEPAEPDDGADVEQHHVAQPHDARELMRLRHGSVGCTFAVSQPMPVPRTAPPSTSVGKCFPADTRRADTPSAPT